MGTLLEMMMVEQVSGREVGVSNRTVGGATCTKARSQVRG